MRNTLSLALIAVLGGCTNGLGNGLQVRGKLASEFVDLTAARSADSGTVDTLVAVPHTRGVPYLEGSHSVPADADANFEITVEDSYDHLFMFVDSTTEDPTVLGFLAMPAGGGSVVNMTTSDAVSDVNTGELNPEDGEAVAEAGLASTFGLTDDQFALLARGDDAYKNISNAWLNRDPDTGVRSRADVNFWFEGSFANSDVPGSALFRGGSLALDTNDPSLVDRIDDACDGALAVELVPPAPVVLDGVTYGPTTPITNAASTACSDGPMSFQVWDDGGVSAALPGFTEPLPSGWWIWNVDGVEMGFFQLDHTLPVGANDQPQVPVPTLEVTETNGGVDVQVQWWVHDGAEFVRFTDLDLLQRILANVGVSVSGDFAEGEWEGGWEDDRALTGVFFDGWTLDGSGQGTGDIVGEISLGYQLAGTQVVFSWRGNAQCGNNVLEPEEVCDSDNDVSATCADFGLFEPGFVSCSNCELDPSTCARGPSATRVSGSQLAFSIGDEIVANTIAFEVTTDTFDFEGVDLWASLSRDASIQGLLPLAPGEDGVFHVGRLGFEETAFVAFQVQSPGVSTGSERLVLSDGPPDALNPPTVLWEGDTETWTVRTAQDASSSHISSTSLRDDGAPLGALQRVVVGGQTADLGLTKRIDLHAATSAAWVSRNVSLESVSLLAWEAGTLTPARLCLDEACTAESNPVLDALVAYAPDSTAIDWEATLTYRVADTLASQVTSSAVVYESATGLQGPSNGVPGATMTPASNALQLSIDDTNPAPSVADPTYWVLLSIDNPSAHDIVVDDVGFALPEHVTVIDQVYWGDESALGINLDPTFIDLADGSQSLVHRGRWPVAANSTSTFQAKIQIDGTPGAYSISPWVGIGETKVTVDTPLVVTLSGS
ncbi:MAG: hypothetical protein KC912_17575 [Proteobacteria bacterium]|nr:hypothetical protein [Pseudomonadota bacterium]